MRISRIWICVSIVITLGLCASVLLRPAEQWAKRFIELGDKNLQNRQFEDALMAYDNAFRMDPENYAALLRAAKVHLGLKKCREALEIYAFMDLKKKTVPAEDNVDRAECYLGLKDPESAIQRGYNPAIAARPDEGVYLYKRGIAYQQLQNQVLAEKDFKQARLLGYASE